MTYRGQGQPMNIGKSNNNFKNRKPKYEYMTKEYQLKKKECETRKCFKYEKEGHIAKDYKGIQLMKKQQV